jgi:hypothetical protein
MVELGQLLSSPGLAPSSLLPQLSAATQRAADAAGYSLLCGPDGAQRRSAGGLGSASASSGGRGSGGGGGGSSGGAGAQFRLGDVVVVGSQQRTRGVIRWVGPGWPLARWSQGVRASPGAFAHNALRPLLLWPLRNGGKPLSTTQE